MESSSPQDGANERVNPADARRVVEQWMAEGGSPTQDWPTVADLAETLRTTPDEIRRMLSRNRSAEVPMVVPVARRPLFSAKAWHVALGIVGVFFIVAAIAIIGWGATAGEGHAASAVELPPSTAAQATGTGTAAKAVTVHPTDIEAVPPPGAMKVGSPR